MPLLFIVWLCVFIILLNGVGWMQILGESRVEALKWNFIRRFMYILLIEYTDVEEVVGVSSVRSLDPDIFADDMWWSVGGFNATDMYLMIGDKADD